MKNKLYKKRIDLCVFFHSENTFSSGILEIKGDMRMNAEKRLALFQNKKHEFDKNDWSIVREDEKTIILTGRKVELLCTLTYLEEETNRFTELEPSVVTHFITRLTDGENDVDEVMLEGEIEGQSFSITLHMEKAEQGKEIEAYSYVFSNEVISSKVAIELTRIYTKFQQVMKESSLYRLCFVASDLTFEEELSIYKG